VVKLETGGPSALVHGNRGRPPSNRISRELRQKILVLADGPYAGCNDTHFVELLAEREGVHIGRETVRSLLRQGGHRPQRKRRPRKHHRRRLRSPAKGLMTLWDGSPHPWLGPGQPVWTLMASLDDADGELLAAFFAPQETSEGYLRLLSKLLARHGIPAAIYQDRHSALRRNDEAWTLEEQLAGRQRPTQVGLALEDLGIRPIFALSPQAKGRIERFFGVAQDRLPTELRLAGVETLEQANRHLETVWIDRYNQRFQRLPESPNSCYRSTEGFDLARILAFRYEATVLNDNTVRLGGLALDIPPGHRGRSFAQAKVDVRQHLDGSWSIYYQDQLIAQAPASNLCEPLRYRRHRRGSSRTKAAPQEQLLYLPNDPNDNLNGTVSLGT
jgi:hypothetical protein